MIFGQGATRCHPYALKVVDAVESDDAAKFRANLLGWLSHFFLGGLRTLMRGLTRGWTVGVPDVAPQTRVYYRRLGWAASRFGFLTDLAMFAIGGKLKVRGKLTGRYADVLAWLILGMSTLRRFEAEGRREEDLPLVHFALHHALAQAQSAFEGIYQNFDGPLGFVLRNVFGPLLRLNPVGVAPDDRLSHRAAVCIQTWNEQYRRLHDTVFVAKDESHGAARLLRAFRSVSEAHPATERIIHAQRARKLPRGYLPAEITDEAVKAGIVNPAEAKLLKEALAARLEAIEVDEFKPEQYFAEVDAAGGLVHGEMPLKRVVNA